jgi:rhamnose transport system ATP-binding protein
MPAPSCLDAPLLRLSNITKSFGAVRALKGVSFELLAGEVHALVGENGAGKSTLIKIITGAHQPDSGTIEIDGVGVTRLNPTSARTCGIAVIYQQPALFPDLSVAENIALALEEPSPTRLVRWNDRQIRADKLLARVGADIEPETDVRRLSMPQQQLVEIARALGAGARMLLMDEPTASLTSREVALLFGLVRDLRSQGVGIIYISHRLEEVFQVADRVTVLRDGESVGTRTIVEPLQPLTVELSEQPPLATTSTLQRCNVATPSSLNESDLIRLMIGREISTIFPPAENVPGEPVLTVRNLACDASGVRDVNFVVHAGEILGLAGLVGAGRTELARVLFGITPPDAGIIELNGKQFRLHSPLEAVKAGIAYVPEDRRRHGVVLDMPVSVNITMGILPRLCPWGWMQFGAERALAEDYIRDLGIRTPSPETRAGNLSGGNQQKVALARWLATEPKVLILDEPTQGVDVGAKAEIHKIIRRLAAQGLAVLMISSELPEILGMSDRIAVMRGGTITAILERHTADAHSVMAAALGQSAGNDECRISNDERSPKS